MNRKVNAALQLWLWGGIEENPAASGSGALPRRSAGGGRGGAASDAADTAASLAEADLEVRRRWADPAGPRLIGPGETKAGSPRRSQALGEAKAGRGSTPRPSSPDLSPDWLVPHKGANNETTEVVPRSSY
jgi:hypothetical protein